MLGYGIWVRVWVRVRVSIRVRVRVRLYWWCFVKLRSGRCGASLGLGSWVLGLESWLMWC